MSATTPYSKSFADISVADVHITKRHFPLLDTVQRCLFLVPQQPDELIFFASSETFVLLKSVQQLTIFFVELAASFTRQQSTNARYSKPTTHQFLARVKYLHIAS